MKPSEIPKYQQMTDEQLCAEIPNWNWFKNLKAGDDAIIWLCDCYFFRNDLNDDGMTLAKVTAIHEDGSVEVDKGNLGRFYYCRVPNTSNAIVCLIPPNKEYLDTIKACEIALKLKQMTKTQWEDLGYEKLNKIIELVGIN